MHTKNNTGYNQTRERKKILQIHTSKSQLSNCKLNNLEYWPIVTNHDKCTETQQDTFTTCQEMYNLHLKRMLHLNKSLV